MMIRQRSRLLGLGAWAMCAGLLACDDATGPATGPGGDDSVATVLLTAPTHTLEVGSDLQLAASVLNGKGAVVATTGVEWTSEAPQVASVTAGGLVTAHAVGQATIRARAGGRQGQVTLTVQPAACRSSAVEGTVAVAQARNGTTGPSDCRFDDWAWAQGWRLRLDAPRTVRLRLLETGTGHGIILTNTAMEFVDGSFAGPENAPSLVTTLEPADYIAWVLDPEGDAGSYSLSVEGVQYCSDPDQGPLVLGEIHDGSLTPQDCVVPHGAPGQGWPLSLTGDATVEVEMQTEGFEALLVVTDRDFQVVAFGTAESDPTRARALMVELPAGEYVVWATTWDTQFGGYQLTARPVVVETCADAAAGALALGQQVTGALSFDDCERYDGRFVDNWELTLSQATTVDLRLQAPFDPYLMLRDDQGRMIAENDDADGTLNSRLVIGLAAGTYRVQATSFAPGVLGAYQLSAAVAAGGVSAATGANGAHAPKAHPLLGTWRR
jgi:hypothetical protein